VGGAVALSLLALVFSSPVALTGYVLVRGRGARVAMHERGFTFQRGSQHSSVLWTEIESYILASAVRVVTKSGEVVELGGGIQGIDEIAQAIGDATLKLMLPQLKAVLMSGSNAEFKGWQLGGKFLASYLGARSGFTVDALGITEKDTGRRILWRAVTGYEIVQQPWARPRCPSRVSHRRSDPNVRDPSRSAEQCARARGAVRRAGQPERGTRINPGASTRVRRQETRAALRACSAAGECPPNRSRNQEADLDGWPRAASCANCWIS